MTSGRPYLLYVYPWMPYPRRVIIYIREKNIPSSLITVVPVSDPQLGDAAPPEYPPRPTGSLPILVIPSKNDDDTASTIYIRQSLAIMNYIEDLCEVGLEGFPKSRHSMRGGTDALSRARHTELLALADECTTAWNPVRMFGTGAGTMPIPAAAKEMMQWIYRLLRTIESWWKDRDFSSLRKGSVTEEMESPTIAEIVLYQFLEFTKDCYGKDMTKGSGAVVQDPYGRKVRDEYTKIADFYEAFKTRNSARRDEARGEVASEAVLKRMTTWHGGST